MSDWVPAHQPEPDPYDAPPAPWRIVALVVLGIAMGLLGLLKTLDEVFDLKGALLQAARQAEPRLNVTPLPDEGDAMRAARARALGDPDS